jgi:hypothetical protein
MSLKLCKDCRWVDWYLPTLGKDIPGNAMCRHPTSIRPARTNLITGAVRPAESASCTEVRQSLVKDRCGEVGQCWEPRGYQASVETELEDARNEEWIVALKALGKFMDEGLDFRSACGRWLEERTRGGCDAAST